MFLKKEVVYNRIIATCTGLCFAAATRALPHNNLPHDMWVQSLRVKV